MSREEVLAVRSELAAGIAQVTLARPPLNILDIAMLRHLEDVLESLARREDVRVLVLGAEGRMFSAGVDVADHTPDRVGEMIPLFDRVCGALADFPVPTLAAVQGHALGGGCELVLCCDLAIAAEGAKLGQPEIQLAAFAPIAALRLPALVGARAAAELMFTGKSLDAAEALRMGLVNAVIPAAELAAAVARQAAHIAGLSRAALTLAKRALRAGAGDWRAAMPAVEALYLQELMATSDAHEGLAAFLEKRAPVWTHR